MAVIFLSVATPTHYPPKETLLIRTTRRQTTTKKKKKKKKKIKVIATTHETRELREDVRERRGTRDAERN